MSYKSDAGKGEEWPRFIFIECKPVPGCRLAPADTSPTVQAVRRYSGAFQSAAANSSARSSFKPQTSYRCDSRTGANSASVRC